MMRYLSFNTRFLVGLLALTVCVSTGAKLQAQQSWTYKKAKSAILDPRKVNVLRRDKNPVLRATGAPTKEQREALYNYYVRHVFAGMTQPAALDDAMRFPSWRKDLVEDLERLRNNVVLYRYLRDDLAFNTLKVLTMNDYHPACRYNAALMIGMLNDQEGDRNSSRPFPTPYKPARDFLVRVVRDQKVPDSVRIAGLLGLRRHAELLAAGGSSDAAMLKLLVDVTRADVGPTANADAAYWQKRLAIQALGAMGPGGAAKILSPIVGDENMPLSVRCAAARALGQLDYRNVSNVDPTAVLKGLGSIAVSACRDEIKRVQKHNADNPGPPEANRPLFGQANEEPEADPIVLQVRRQLKHRLNCVTKGIDGIEKIASQPDQKNTVTTIRSQINAIQRGLDEGFETMTPEDLLNKIGPPAIQLEDVVKGNA